jgi:hypothetical protein
VKIELYNYKDLNIVEFVSGDGSAECKLCSENSKYLHGSVFSIIQGAFDLSNKDYSYYDLTEFKDQNLISLRNHLQDHFSRLHSTVELENFEAYLLKQVEGIDFLNELKNFYPNWKINWENIKHQLLDVYEDILDIIDNCIDEDRSFWLKGY